MAVKEDIKFYYSYDNHEKAMQSFLLLSYLLRERVSFTAIPIEGGLSFPEVWIKTSTEEIPSSYSAHYFNNSEITENFVKQCRAVRESSLEEAVRT